MIHYGLEESDRAANRFISLASHDLKEPLRTIASYLHLLEERCGGSLDSTAREFLNFSQGAAKRMAALIDSLLEFAQAGTVELKPVPTHLNALVDQTLQGLGALIRETGAEIVTKNLPDMKIDPLLVGLVFQHLIRNAIEFRKPGTRPVIQIAAKKEEGEWLFWIQDNGIGFPQENQNRIFEPLQRLHGRDEYPGSGMGLALCRRILSRHGGKIWALGSTESKPDSGTTLFFTLPL